MPPVSSAAISGSDALVRGAAHLGLGNAKPVLIDLNGPTAVQGDPDLYCPFPSYINPGLEAAQVETLRWAARLGLVDPGSQRDRVALERYTGLVARMFPEGDPEQFQVISDFTSWLFLHDDLCDESDLSADPALMSAFFDRELLLLLGRIEPVSPIERALTDIRDRLDELAPDAGWLSRFICSFQDYFEACVWEAANRERGVTPAASTFIPLRRCAGAVWIYLHFIDLMAGRTVPLVIREHRDIQRLRQITCNVVAWHNDIYSLPKEVAAGDVHNLVTVLGRENRLDDGSALDLAIQYTNSEVHTFAAIAARNPHRQTDKLERDWARYVGALGIFIRGALDWAREAVRYSPVTAPDRTAGPPTRTATAE